MDVAERTGQPASTTKAVVSGFTSAIADALAEGQTVHVRGLGTFDVADRAPRIARDVHRGAEMALPARRTAVFRPEPSLKDL